MARIAVAVSDLLLMSRMVEPLKAAGHETVTGPFPGVAEGVDLIVCDLDEVEPEAVGELGIPSIGFYSHLDVETGDRARGAGLDRVVPRSRAARELPDLVSSLLG